MFEKCKKMQTKWKFLILLGCIATLIFCIFFIVKKDKLIFPNRPHVIIIVADDLGWNDVSFHGSDEIPTPNIDALAYNGVILNRHYVLPTCTSSRTSLLTGRYAIREGLQEAPSLRPGEIRSLPLNVTLMPEYFRRLGYATKLIGKWHLGYPTENHTPARRGFDTFFGYYNGFIGYFDHEAEQGEMLGADLHRDGPDGLGIASDSRYFTDLITDEAVKIIKSNSNTRPLFLEIAHLAVHAGSADDPLEVRNISEANENFPHIWNKSRRKYAAMVKSLDDSVGKVVRALGEARMLANSIIVFISDNGAPTVGTYNNTGSNYPLRGIKGTLFEGAVRGVACVFSPLIKSRSRLSEQMMHISDWLPSLYAAAGGNAADIDGPIDGVNQWPAVASNAPPPRRSVLINLEDRREAAVIEPFKLVRGANYEFDGFYGEGGTYWSYPKYQVGEVLLSPTGIAIRRLTNHISPSLSTARRLRKKSRVYCQLPRIPVNCSTACLFNLRNDPCESQNLFAQFPEIVLTLEVLINKYRSVSVRQEASITEPCSNPRYFNGTWMPWRKADNISQTIISPAVCEKFENQSTSRF